MSENPVFDYYYGDESSQFSFYRIPRQLITGDLFKRLSTDAKLLYGLLLDRMGLSVKNGWYDDLGRVYIYYTLSEIQEDLNCGHDKAVKLLSELDTGKGFGLIERVKQGQGRPTKIYVKRFTTKAVPPPPPEPEQEPPPRLPVIGSADFGKAEVKTSDYQKSRLRETRSPDFGKSAGSYIKSIQTDPIQLNPSIHPSPSPLCGTMMDRYDCRREVEENIDYTILCERYGREDMDEMAELITDVLCTNRSTFRIGGEDLPAAQVKSRFYKLDSGHLEYVFDCLRKNTTQIRNIRAYLLTALYNAPATISNYYQAEVQHDFGP